jgi:hypothetical protein
MTELTFKDAARLVAAELAKGNEPEWETSLTVERLDRALRKVVYRMKKQTPSRQFLYVDAVYWVLVLADLILVDSAEGE